MLTGVVPIAQSLTMADGRPLMLLSLNRWTNGFDLQYATTGSDHGLGDDGPLDWDWTLTDDRGMSYSVRRGGGGGGGSIHWMRMQAVPALPDDARSLRVAARATSGGMFSTTIDLEGTVSS